MDRDWMSEEVVEEILDVLGDEEMRLTEIASRIASVRGELVARHVGVMAAYGLLGRRGVDGRDLYVRVVSQRRAGVAIVLDAERGRPAVVYRARRPRKRDRA